MHNLWTILRGGEEGIEDRIDVELRREGEEGGDPGFDPASF